jgi:hypothetical protein
MVAITIYLNFLIESSSDRILPFGYVFPIDKRNIRIDNRPPPSPKCPIGSLLRWTESWPSVYPKCSLCPLHSRGLEEYESGPGVGIRDCWPLSIMSIMYTILNLENTFIYVNSYWFERNCAQIVIKCVLTHSFWRHIWVVVTSDLAPNF